MTKSLSDLMRQARDHVSAGRLDQATSVIGEALSGKRHGAAGGDAKAARSVGDDIAPKPGDRAAPGPLAGIGDRLKALLPPVAGRPRFPMPMPAAQSPASPGSAGPDGARFEMRIHAGPHGSRRYRLYVPARPAAGPRPLLVMLHGCTQDPDDFARGTRMNALAEEAGVLVAYPEQPASANARMCWNWFEPAHQRGGAGEPAILAGIVEDIAAAFAIDRRRIFAAGLSAGGAMAAVLGAAHPDLFAAIGVHSGLPAGSASDVMSALAVMRNGQSPAGLVAPSMPMIVFHGDRDRTVHLANGEALAGPAAAGSASDTVEEGRRGGRSYTRRVRAGDGGRPGVEFWTVEGLGHAWSGGDEAGTYADPAGPNASREMLRFFLGVADRRP